MIIQSDYSYELPDDHAPAIITGIDDDSDRERIQEAIDATEAGDPVQLPVMLADVLLNAYAEWERNQS